MLVSYVHLLYKPIVRYTMCMFFTTHQKAAPFTILSQRCAGTIIDGTNKNMLNINISICAPKRFAYFGMENI